MQHPDKKQLLSFLQDSLSEELNQRVDAHISGCPQCCDAIETLIGSTIRMGPPQDSGLSSAAPSSEEKLSKPESSLKFDFGLQFLFFEKIASGGMGTVYRGFDRELKREVAIKVAHERRSGESRFYREAQISGQLQHPGIVPVHEMGRLEDGRLYIAMRLVRGETLLKLIRDRDPQSISPKLLEMFGQICSAMAYAHSKHFVHRDLKPENVMVGPFGEVQVMDWGLAKKLTPNVGGEELPEVPEAKAAQDTFDPMVTSPGAVLGTPAYMAPEQASGNPATKRSDVFLLGGILFEILTGNAPFRESSTQSQGKSAASELVKAYASLDITEADPELVSIAKSCLAADPADRPEDAEAVNRQFRQYIDNREEVRQQSKLNEARVTERLVAQQKRNRQLVWFSAAIASVLVVSALLGYMYLTEKNVRVANQINLKRDQLEQKLNHQFQLRESMAMASKHQQFAEQLIPERQFQQWGLALKEIEKGTSFLSSSTDEPLRNEFEELGKMIRDRAAMANRAKASLEVERASREQILACCEESYYPDELRSCRNANLTTRLAAAFKRLGVEVNQDSVESVQRISNSRFKTDFLLGLIVWRREIDWDTKLLKAGRRDPDELNSKLDWLGNLINKCDPDPFRTEMRRLHAEAKFRELSVLLGQPESASSMLTVHFAAECLQDVFPDLDQRVEYLRRVQQNFPNDFFGNWYMVALVPQRVRLQFALSCYALRPKNSAVLDTMGVSHVRQKEFERAIEVLEELVNAEPSFGRAHKFLAISYGEVGRRDEAIEHFEKALTLTSKLNSIGDIFYSRAEMYRAGGRLDDAIADYLKWIDANPRSTRAHSGLAAVYRQQGRFQDAILSQATAIRINPNTKLYFAPFSAMYIELFKKLIDEGRDEEAHATLESAIRDFTEIASLAPELSTPHESLLKVCEKLENHEQAIAAIKKLIEVQPLEYSYQTKMANLCSAFCKELESEGKLQQAVDMLEDSTGFLTRFESEHDHLVSLYDLSSSLLRKLGQFEKAIRSLKKAVELKPKKRLFLQRLGNLYVANDQLDLAEKTFRRLLIDNSVDPDSIACFANLYLVNEMPQKSESIIRNAVSDGVNSPEMQLILARSVLDQGLVQKSPAKAAEGRKILDELKEVAPHLKYPSSILRIGN